MVVAAHEVELFERARARLAAIAYRLLGSATDAEDAVQDTFLRWQSADREHIGTPEAWLTKVLTNICLNRLTSARARRETYVGQWLPEPVLAGDPLLGPSATVEQRESVSIAMLTLMERLSARERVVYVLREAFGYSHGEIAEVLDLTESNCQQIYRRARQHLAEGRRRVAVDASAARKIVAEFLAAALSGRTDSLVKMLADDAISVGDGGGVVFSLPRPVTGALRVARFLRTLFQPSAAKWEMIGGRPVLYAAVANGAPALVMTVGDRVAAVVTLDVTTDGVAAVHAQANPGKLDRATRQWASADHGDPLVDTW
ncbi:RNA polymerase sigma-70 factor [Amycolatopsis viridis]|uniref:RNA polymerase sigma-70 factor (ECF subfamily) n=1 Tax=Amycolatopsis viridis TaxID=185678 RepID=A0ABX0T157_9PSEU|nr:RNA polymerase sigma-70 factor [Amycolatopsis viridis]NIH82483.1 RNA polymerase sigma-70 factor (ECF subfamily) [Amycolatopsis viridis]